MPDTTFYILFGVAWVAAMAYALSAFRLLAKVRQLKAEGRAAAAPDPLSDPFAVFDYLTWLLTGRYAGLGDEVVSRWAAIARILFVITVPLVLAAFVIAFTLMGGSSQPT